MSQQLGERATLAPTDGLSFLIGPPSTPRNLSFSISGTQLSLRWEPPADLGEREDIRYNVECSQCQGAALDGGPCQPCGAGVRFSAGPRGLTASSVRVDGLDPHANYTFSVEAQNGVSGLGASKPASASLSINMGSAGEGPVGQQGLEKTGSRGSIGPWGQVDG